MSDSEEEFENWCKESDDGGEDLKAHDEESRAILDELPISNCLVHVISCNTHPDAPHGFLRNASHNADRYVCECEHWEEPKMITNLMLMDRLRKDVEELRARIELMEKNTDND